MNSRIKNIGFKRILSYVIGMTVLAMGLTLNTKLSLGVSPLLSTAFSTSEIYGFTLANASLVMYVLLVFAEILLHIKMKSFVSIPIDAAQIPITVLFTRVMAVFDIFIPNYATGSADSFFYSLTGRYILLIIAIVLIGIGAAMTMNARLVPNPGDGIVLVISDFLKKEVGDVKNVFDISCVGITLLICVLSGSTIVGIGVGSVLGMLLTGRVIAVYNWMFVKRKVEA
ncbi:MAG: DUF6198 family protein [Lachnospiraceae bacterium]|nr:DUF6198 family protein [Lachnospiraceae bacterium]